MRLNKYLAHCGVASRRKCDQLIYDKKISINGIIVTDYSYNVSYEDIVVYEKSGQIGLELLESLIKNI